MKVLLKSVKTLEDIDNLIIVEELAWGSPGENVLASRAKIEGRINSGQCISLAMCDGKPIGSQYAFRFNWDGDTKKLGSWDKHTAEGWTDKVHIPNGNTGFLIGVGVIPEFRGLKFENNLRLWPADKISRLLIAFTLRKMFDIRADIEPVKSIIGNARVPFYHLHADLSIKEYCKLRREDGKLFDPVLRFHKSMGAELIKPCKFSMEDAESLNAGCWVKYEPQIVVER